MENVTTGKQRYIDVPLKGNRSYIQGPDLYDLAYSYFSEREDAPLLGFEIAFHRMAERQIELVSDTAVTPADAFAVGAYLTDAGRVSFWFREGTLKLTQRVPYQEDDLVARLDYDAGGKGATLSESVGFSDMETWVAIIKAVHLRHFDGANGKWVFVRAKMTEYSSTNQPAVYRVKLASTLGLKLTRNEVFLDDLKVGDVFFALI